MKLTLTRTPIYIDTKPVRTRVVFFRVDLDDGTSQTWPGIENGDDPDKIPAGEYPLTMEQNERLGQFLWVPDKAHGGPMPDPVDGEVQAQLLVHVANRAAQLKGCAAIGRVLWTNPPEMTASRFAMDALMRALGGFEVDKRVPFECIDLEEVVCETCSGKGWCDHSAVGRGPMAYAKFPCPDCMPDDLVTRPAAPEWEFVDVHDGDEWDERNAMVGDNLNEGDRWTRLPEGDVMIERRK